MWFQVRCSKFGEVTLWRMLASAQLKNTKTNHLQHTTFLWKQKLLVPFDGVPNVSMALSSHMTMLNT